jgi:hypothetical protein
LRIASRTTFCGREVRAVLSLRSEDEPKSAAKLSKGLPAPFCAPMTEGVSVGPVEGVDHVEICGK